MARIKLSKTHKIIISSVAAVIALLLIAGGVYCIVTDQNPSQAANSIFSSGEEQIVGKWQSSDNPGINAFVFYEDGTYDSYISTTNFSGEYEIDGRKLILKNPNTSKEIVYRFSVNEKKLRLTVIEEDGEKSESEDESSYDRVDELNQKSIFDIIGELKEEEESTEATQKSAE